MAEIQKDWGDGRQLNISYVGEKDGDVTYSSSQNDDLDVSIEVTIATGAGGLEIKQTVNQAGLREVFSCSDGDFTLADGGTFNVLKP